LQNYNSPSAYKKHVYTNRIFDAVYIKNIRIYKKQKIYKICLYATFVEVAVAAVARRVYITLYSTLYSWLQYTSLFIYVHKFICVRQRYHRENKVEQSPLISDANFFHLSSKQDSMVYTIWFCFKML
jgi:hypothetical protein